MSPQRSANASNWPSKALIQTSGRMTVLVSYQPRPISRGPFCHTQIPVEDQKDLTRPQSSLIISIRRGRLERALFKPSASLVNN